MGVVGIESIQSHQLYIFLNPLVPLLPAHISELQAEGDVGEHRPPGEEAEILKDEAAVVAGPAHREAVYQNPAGGGRYQPAHDAKECGLAATTGAHDGEELLLLDIEGDLMQRLNLIPIPTPM